MASLFDLPVFCGQAGKLVTGHKRLALPNDEARRRWDYFFRATPGTIEGHFANEKTQHRDQLAAGKARRVAARVGLFFLVLVPIGIAVVVWFGGHLPDLVSWLRNLMRELKIDAKLNKEALIAILSAPLGLLVLIGLAKYLPRLGEASGSVREAKRKLRELKRRIGALIKQIPHNTPSDKEMVDFVNARLTDLEQRAKQYLRLNQASITIEVAIPPIQEWAYLQPQDKPGYQSIRRNNPEFLEAIQATGHGPIYAVYYIQYLFPTKDYIAVHGEFFDAISDDTRGKLTDEYYYADVTSVRTEVSEVERRVYFSNKIPELVKLRLTVASGDAVEVRMLDERVQRTLNEYLADRQRANVDTLKRLQASLDNASRQEKAAIQQELEEAASARQRVLQDDRASFAEGVVRDIRHQLRLKKGTEPKQG